MPAGSWPRRRRLPAHPSGVIPVSNSSRRTRPPLRISTSAENPCWASGTSAALPPTIVGVSSSGASRAIAAKREPLGRALVRQQYVRDVVADRQHRQLVDRLQRKDLTLPLQGRRQRFGRRDLGTVTDLTHGCSSPACTGGSLSPGCVTIGTPPPEAGPIPAPRPRLRIEPKVLRRYTPAVGVRTPARVARGYTSPGRLRVSEQAATAMSRTVKAAVSREASTRDATRLPASAPASAAAVNTPGSGQSRWTWPPRRAASAAALLIAMTSSEVPTATGMSKLRASTSAGTMTNPPPTPKKLVSRPTPVAAAAIFRPWRTAAIPPGRCQAADEAGARTAAAGLSRVAVMAPPRNGEAPRSSGTAASRGAGGLAAAGRCWPAARVGGAAWPRRPRA